MGKELKTIYELFCDYTEKEIDDVIESLSSDEKILLFLRYGDDFHKPVTSDEWDSEKSKKFYNYIIPKISRRLNKNRKQMIISEDKTDLEQVLKAIQATHINNVDYSSQLLKMLKQGTTGSEMCETLNISSRQLCDELLKLKNNGIAYSKEYGSNGSIFYHRISSVRNLNIYNNATAQNDRTIAFDKRKNELKVLAISDLHFGNELERIDLVNRAFNYCIKNNINIILCGGDIIDGTFTKAKQKISDPREQVEYFMKNYPQDKNILTFSVAGDHDLDAFYKSSLNIIEVCENFRHDVVIGGFNNAIININDDKIQLYHHIMYGRLIKTSAPIILHGHSHKYFTSFVDDVLNITLPTLSNIFQPMPTVLELEFSFKNGYITEVIVKQIYFDSQDILLNESVHKIKTHSKNNQDAVKKKALKKTC